jgi:hypothetical protein
MKSFDTPRSSNIVRVSHDGQATLRVSFKNGTEYDYTGVPESVFEEMRQAPSAGSFLARVIKPKYPASPATRQANLNKQ